MAENESKNKNFVSKQDSISQKTSDGTNKSVAATVDFPSVKATDKAQETIFEGMTSISAILNASASGINSRQILRVYFDRERLAKKEKEYRFLSQRAEQLGFSVILTDRAALDRMTTGDSHGGIVAVCSERHFPALSEAISDSALPFRRDDGFFVLLEGIEDPYNFGYTLRSLYAAGCDGVILSPRNWMEVAGIVARSSAGASEQLPMAIEQPAGAVACMRERGYRIACAGIRDSVPMYEANLRPPLLLVVGGEKRGISASVLSMADQVVRIDYGRSFQGSLSAASAATVLAFEVLHQRIQGK